ncbi:hypothetical protein EJ07DRAFT_172142 [Lizonia empirigonia]|nr:hypothetical protein EJ07DRAFT_172142 [Lizonia empirigonia]
MYAGELAALDAEITRLRPRYLVLKARLSDSVAAEDRRKTAAEEEEEDDEDDDYDEEGLRACMIYVQIQLRLSRNHICRLKL